MLIMEFLQYHMISSDGGWEIRNTKGNIPIAVTWGAFPSSEISQPTVVDPISFHVWKDEAFDAWLSQWAKLYPEESASRATLKHIHDTYILVNLVDNEFPKPTCLWDLLAMALQNTNSGAGAAALPEAAPSGAISSDLSSLTLLADKELNNTKTVAEKNFKHETANGGN